MLPAIERILEESIIKHFKENMLIISEQSGFRSNHSCETTIQYILHNWNHSLDMRETVIPVFLDFCRAFETIDSLLHKLDDFGIKGTACGNG